MIIESFPHKKGVHCESTTLRDHLNYLGFEMSEPMAFGLDATMGFGFWDFEPDSKFDIIIGGKGSMFSEQSLACRVLGVLIDKATFTRGSEAWTDTLTHLTQGRPQMIQADLGFFPFIIEDQDLQEDLHFGGHLLSIVGYDSKKDVALLADNNYDEYQEISLDLLEKARGSKHGWKGMWPHYVRYILSRRPDGKRPPLIAGVKLAIQQAVKNMIATSTSMNGIPAITRFGESIDIWKEELIKDEKFASKFLHQLYGYIEEYGTGGSLFRALYGQFLNEILIHPEISTSTNGWKENERETIEEANNYISDSAKRWAEFAQIIKQQYSNSPSDFQSMDYSHLKNIIEEIAQLEQHAFKMLSKIKI